MAKLLPSVCCEICGLASLIAKSVFMVITNDAQEAGVSGNYAVTAVD